MFGEYDIPGIKTMNSIAGSPARCAAEEFPRSPTCSLYSRASHAGSRQMIMMFFVDNY